MQSCKGSELSFCPAPWHENVMDDVMGTMETTNGNHGWNLMKPAPVDEE
jgi:hypothetical protein